MRSSVFFRPLAAVSVILGVAACSDSTSPTPNPGIQFVNAIATSNQLDFSINGLKIGSSITFRSFTSCQYTEPGTYTIGITATGSTTPLVPTFSMTLNTSGRYTVIATGPSTALASYVVLNDDYGSVSNGRAKVRPFNALTTNTSVDMYVGDPGANLGSANASSVTYQSTYAFVDIPSGQREIKFTNAGTQNVLATTGAFAITNKQGIDLVLAENAGGGGARTFVVPVCP